MLKEEMDLVYEIARAVAKEEIKKALNPEPVKVPPVAAVEEVAAAAVVVEGGSD